MIIPVSIYPQQCRRVQILAVFGVFRHFHFSNPNRHKEVSHDFNFHFPGINGVKYLANFLLAIYIYSFGKYLLDFCLFSLNYLSLGCEFFICSTYNYNVRYMYYNYFLLFHFINELLSMNLLFPSHFINGIFY